MTQKKPRIELRDWRKERGLSLAKAAAKLGVAAVTWWDWERENGKVPRIAIATRLEKLTGKRVRVADWAEESNEGTAA